MKKKLSKVLAMLLALVMVLALAACGGNDNNSSSSNDSNSSSSNNSSSSSNSSDSSDNNTTPADDKAVPPNDGNTTLKIFCQSSVWLPSNETDPSTSPFLTALQENTGVTLDLTAISGDTQQQFNLMVAGGKDNLPDIIDNTNMFEGGASAAYQSGYIIDLTPYIDEYCSNYRKYLDEHPEIDRLMKTDDGLYLTFPMIRGDDALCSFNGLTVRKDWLDADDLDIPVTMDDW